MGVLLDDGWVQAEVRLKPSSKVSGMVLGPPIRVCSHFTNATLVGLAMDFGQRAS